MDFYSFKQKYFQLGCFSIHSIESTSASALSSNLTRWTREGKIVKLRSGWYAFPERVVSFADRMFCAGKIYSPSYASLYTALSYYEMIPESVSAITSVTTLKTKSFSSMAGLMSYFSVKQELFFGYVPVVDRNSLPYLMATPEKALLDLMYLHPEYRTEEEFENLRLDGDFMAGEFNWETARGMCSRWNVSTMQARLSIVEKIYR
ncbi:MAG: hypothetical protein IKP46_06940 [Bacteroidales bacterium]|nr:hypothetical protein [Bacteroidales bacterium]